MTNPPIPPLLKGGEEVPLTLALSRQGRGGDRLIFYAIQGLGTGLL
jgi:hypothetical protein